MRVDPAGCSPHHFAPHDVGVQVERVLVVPVVLVHEGQVEVHREGELQAVVPQVAGVTELDQRPLALPGELRLLQCCGAGGGGSRGVRTGVDGGLEPGTNDVLDPAWLAGTEGPHSAACRTSRVTKKGNEVFFGSTMRWALVPPASPSDASPLVMALAAASRTSCTLRSMSRAASSGLASGFLSSRRDEAEPAPGFSGSNLPRVVVEEKPAPRLEVMGRAVAGSPRAAVPPRMAVPGTMAVRMPGVAGT